MIRRLSQFASNFVALLSDDSVSNMEDRIDCISHAMLDELAPYLTQQPVLPEAWFKIALATDIQTLWYLRGDLLGLLSEYCGEPDALRKVSAITKMFSGIFPEGRSSRTQRRK